MDAFSTHTRITVPPRHSNVDTDQIIPAVYLKRVTRTGFEDGLSAGWRSDPDFVLNHKPFTDGTVLVPGPDFGTSSSREHAVWALQNYGFKVIMGTRFDDVFRSNLNKAGLLVALAMEEDRDRLWDAIETASEEPVTVDLPEQTVTRRDLVIGFKINEYAKYRSLNGLDNISMTLQHDDEIGAYETTRPGSKLKTLPVRTADTASWGLPLGRATIPTVFPCSVEVKKRPWQRFLHEASQETAPRAYRFLARLVHPVMGGLIRRTWRGQKNVPSGRVLVVSNHPSDFDVPTTGEFLVWSGRRPRYLGKSEIWKVPMVRWFARECRQIPIIRHSERAKDSLVHAHGALEAGECVTIFPEGIITADPDGWPMTGRLGAVRLALMTEVPVILVRQVGTDTPLGQEKLELYRLFSLRRRPVMVRARPPVDLSVFPVGEEPAREDVERASVAIMDAIIVVVAELRGGPVPEGRWDMRVGVRVPQRG